MCSTAEWRDREIVYTTGAADMSLTPGQAGADAASIGSRRYRLMRLHFAAELALEVVNRRLSRPEKIGAHIAEDKARIDFAWPSSLAPSLPDIAADIAALVAADLPIDSAFSDAANERRVWRIDGFAEVACGGTHLRRTGEVGPVALKRRNPGKDRERIEIALVDRDAAAPPPS